MLCCCTAVTALAGEGPARYDRRGTRNAVDADVGGPFTRFGRKHALVVDNSFSRRKGESGTHWSGLKGALFDGRLNASVVCFQLQRVQH